jgi:uncharacterized protein (TIGR02611 family)
VAQEEEEQHPLIEKLHERRIRHQERGLVKRVGVIVIGFFLVLAGIVMSGPGVPGPGIATILLGLTFLALEFDRAERMLERAIIWGDHAKDRAENSSPRERAVTAVAGVLVVAAVVVAALLWDIPLVPVA